MKIDVNGAYRAYAKNTAPQPAQDKSAGRGESRITVQQDRVSISSAAHKNDIDRLVYSTAAEVEAKGSAARVSELRQAVAAGSYSVPTERLADAVLNTII